MQNFRRGICRAAAARKLRIPAGTVIFRMQRDAATARAFILPPDSPSLSLSAALSSPAVREMIQLKDGCAIAHLAASQGECRDSPLGEGVTLYRGLFIRESLLILRFDVGASFA